MTTNFKNEGIDIDRILVKMSDKNKIPAQYRNMNDPLWNMRTLWSWGNNSYGQLGLGDFTHRSSPVQVGTLTNWSKIAGGGNHSLAIKTDGTLWTWGYNRFGQLGLGDTTYRSSPVQVGALTNWSQIAGGSNHSLATQQ